MANKKKRVSGEISLCPRCRGRGYNVRVAGPHVRDGQAFPGGPLRYDCLFCDGTGRDPSQPAAKTADDRHPADRLRDIAAVCDAYAKSCRENGWSAIGDEWSRASNFVRLAINEIDQ